MRSPLPDWYCLASHVLGTFQDSVSWSCSGSAQEWVSDPKLLTARVCTRTVYMIVSCCQHSQSDAATLSKWAVAFSWSPSPDAWPRRGESIPWEVYVSAGATSPPSSQTNRDIWPPRFSLQPHTLKPADPNPPSSHESPAPPRLPASPPKWVWLSGAML